MRKKIITSITISLMIIISMCIPIHAFPPSSDYIYDGIDISEWQGGINFREVKNSGIDMIYIRASEGTNYVDAYFRDNYKGAKENGLKVGFYHFLTATNIEESKEEARFFVNTIKETEPDLKLAMDFEVFDGMNNDEINEIARAFLQTVEDLTGKECVIYSDAYNAEYTFSKELAKKYAIWVADYEVEEPANNGKWSSWVGFQYTDQGEINGIDGYVDRDKFTNGILLNDTSKIPEDVTEDTKKEAQYVTVQYGDTLSGIAEEYNTSYEYLAKINDIANPNLIYVGQKIEVVGLDNNQVHDTSHILYNVQRGDTLTWIAEEYGVTIESIVQLNNIQNPNLIYVGEVLRIPSINN